MFKGKSKKNKSVSILLLTGLFLGIMNQPIVSEAVTPERPSWTFDFNGTKEEFTVLQSGNYMIETYGAQGESSGGLGGYTKGTIRLETGNDNYFR